MYAAGLFPGAFMSAPFRCKLEHTTNLKADLTIIILKMWTQVAFSHHICKPVYKDAFWEVEIYFLLTA